MMKGLMCVGAAAIGATIVQPHFAIAQPCQPEWRVSEGLAGFDTGSGIANTVEAAVVYDPDYEGPLGPHLAVAGKFSLVANVKANGIAVMDLQSGTWSSLGLGFDGPVYALCVNADGDLIAGGDFRKSGVKTLHSLARWDGSKWNAMGSGTTREVLALAAMPNGDVYAAGNFTALGTVAANYIARWNGQAWSALGSGTSSPISCLAVLPNGELVAGGSLSKAGGIDVEGVASWNGISWKAMSGGLKEWINELRLLPNGDLIAAGNITWADGSPASMLARWDGVRWWPFTERMTSWVLAMDVLPSGHVLAGGEFSQLDGQPIRGLAEWDGTAWRSLGGGIAFGDLNPAVTCIRALPNGGCFVGGQFTSADGLGALHGAIWDGRHWSAIARGADSGIRSATVASNGDMLAFGDFATIGDRVVAGRVARWNGSRWSAIGDGFIDGVVYAMAELPDGRLVAGGTFQHTRAGPVRSLAIFDGHTWTELLGGLSSGAVHSLQVASDGSLYIGGTFTKIGDVAALRIAKWDGQSLTSLGSGVSKGTSVADVNAIACLSSGDLVAGGGFDTAGGTPCKNIARWDGQAWHPLGIGVSSGASVAVDVMHVRPNGDLVVGGSFTSAGDVDFTRYIARWDGTQWRAYGRGMDAGVGGLAELPNGNLLASGGFYLAGDAAVNRLARWDGQIWHPLESELNRYSAVGMAIVRPNGDLFVCGSFMIDDRTPSFGYVVQRMCLCPGDFNDDGFLNAADYDAYADAFDRGDQAADFNQDGFVNADDFDQFLERFERGC